jgi:hypothetical protein
MIDIQKHVADYFSDSNDYGYTTCDLTYGLPNEPQGRSCVMALCRSEGGKILAVSIFFHKDSNHFGLKI